MQARPKSFYLFISLVALMILYPLASYNGWSQLIFRILLSGCLLGGIYAISENRRNAVVGLSLLLPSLLANFVLLFHYSKAMMGCSGVIGVSFFVYLVYVLLAHALRDHEVDADTIYCAVAAYLLSAVGFGVLYVTLEAVCPGSFKGDFHPMGLLNFSFGDGVYFSVCTLTTVGYGDLIPVGNEARCVAMLESMFGILYPSILIARLVALYSSRPGR